MGSCTSTSTPDRRHYEQTTHDEKRNVGMTRVRRGHRDFTFGWRFFKHLGKLTPLLFPRLFDWAPLFMLVMLGCALANKYVGYYSGLITGYMYKALSEKTPDDFWYYMWSGSLLYMGKCLLDASVGFASWLLYLAFRRNLVRELHKRYFSNNFYYRINVVDTFGIDNPDQRLTQDIEKITNLLAINILPAALVGPFVVGFYTWKTYQTAGGIGIGMIYVYFVIGTIVNKLLMSPMAKWGARTEKYEGDFRYKHVSIRDNAESVALYEAQEFEKYESNRIFNILLWKQFFFMLWKYPNQFWQTLFDWYGGMFSYAISYVPIFMLHTYDGKSGGDLSMIISQFPFSNSFVYIMLINSFTTITDVAISVGAMAGILQRVSELLKYYEHDSRQGYENESYGSTRTIPGFVSHNPESEILFELQNVTYSLPCDPNHKIIEGLNLQIRKKQNLVITGPSGAGKSSLLRIIARLWSIDKGMIQQNVSSSYLLHLPQTPYFPAGELTLKQQICFPQIITPNSHNDTEIDTILLNILASLKLSFLVDRCGGMNTPVDFEWDDVMTPGEQQRLSFARVLYHKPVLAILDEATSSVSVDMEQTMYELLQQFNIAYVSAGHRPSLMRYHNVELRLDGDGWSVVDLSVQETL